MADKNIEFRSQNSENLGALTAFPVKSAMTAL